MADLVLHEQRVPAFFEQVGDIGAAQRATRPPPFATVFTQLRDLGFPMRTARISALRQLVLQAPAPVIAEALGFHHTTTQRPRANAAGTWSRYPGTDHTR